MAADPADDLAAKRVVRQKEELGELLGQGTHSIQGARLVGQGMAASLDLYMVDGVVVKFPSISKFTAPTTLANTITMATGKGCPILSMVDINRALVMVKQIAAHELSTDEDDVAIGWALDYQQTHVRRTLSVDVEDRLQRWGAHLLLKDPRNRDTIIELADGTRWIKTQWFADYVRACDPSAGGVAQVATRMERVGWKRRGTRGRVKATDPRGEAKPIYHSFFEVPPNWEEAQTSAGDDE